MGWFKNVLRGGAEILGFIRKPDLVGTLVSDHPLPVSMEPGVIYIVGGPGYQKWATFRCPGHKDEIIQLSLMPSRRPSWSLTMDFLDRPTITPSVRQLDGAYAHFWVRVGAVDWCSDTGRRPPTQASDFAGETSLDDRHRHAAASGVRWS